MMRKDQIHAQKLPDLNPQKWWVSFAFTLFFVGLLLNSHAVLALKCWNTEDGSRACGDTVPPEYAQQGYERKNELGMTIEKQGAARSIEDVEAEFRAKREQEIAAAEARKKAKLDQNLLDTFSSEEDIVFARDGAVDHLESQIRLTENRNDKLQTSLDSLISKAADQERLGKEPSESLLADIQSLQQQIDANDTFINAKRREQQKIVEKFDFDIQRFRKLSGAGLN